MSSRKSHGASQSAMHVLQRQQMKDYNRSVETASKMQFSAFCAHSVSIKRFATSLAVEPSAFPKSEILKVQQYLFAWEWASQDSSRHFTMSWRQHFDCDWSLSNDQVSVTVTLTRLMIEVVP